MHNQNIIRYQKPVKNQHSSKGSSKKPFFVYLFLWNSRHVIHLHQVYAQFVENLLFWLGKCEQTLTQRKPGIIFCKKKKTLHFADVHTMHIYTYLLVWSYFVNILFAAKLNRKISLNCKNDHHPFWQRRLFLLLGISSVFSKQPSRHPQLHINSLYCKEENYLIIPEAGVGN